MIWYMCLSVNCLLFVIPIHSQKTEKTFLTLSTLKVISIKFLLEIAMLCIIEWLWELRTWPHKMNLLDILSTSPLYVYSKWGRQMRNLILILRFKGLRQKSVISLPSLRSRRSPLACLPRASPFSLSPATSKRLLRRLFATLFNVRDLVLWPWFILFHIQNLAIFNTDIMEYYFFGKNPWYRQCSPF